MKNEKIAEILLFATMALMVAMAVAVSLY